MNSGGVAIGHPLAATGTRITTHLIWIKRRGCKYGVAQPVSVVDKDCDCC